MGIVADKWVAYPADDVHAEIDANLDSLTELSGPGRATDEQHVAHAEVPFDLDLLTRRTAKRTPRDTMASARKVIPIMIRLTCSNLNQNKIPSVTASAVTKPRPRCRTSASDDQAKVGR